MRAIADRHPNLVTWLVLSVGMLVVLYWSARDVDLNGRQLFWLGAATVVLAGLCAWIISWEADEPEEEEGSAADEGAMAEAGPGPEHPPVNSSDAEPAGEGAVPEPGAGAGPPPVNASDVEPAGEGGQRGASSGG